MFDKYASGAKTGGYGGGQQQRLGENIDTQYTINNADEYVGGGYGQYGQQQQGYASRGFAAEDEYKVDFDPEILADL